MVLALPLARAGIPSPHYEWVSIDEIEDLRKIPISVLALVSSQ
jgi:hypothetical protein